MATSNNAHTYPHHALSVQAIQIFHPYLGGKQDRRRFLEGVQASWCNQNGTTHHIGRMQSWPCYHRAYSKCSRGHCDLSV